MGAALCWTLLGAELLWAGYVLAGVLADLGCGFCLFGLVVRLVLAGCWASLGWWLG